MDPTRGAVPVGVGEGGVGRGGLDCNGMELVAAGWCTRKWLRFDRTIRNLICSDMVNPACGGSTGNKRIKKDKKTRSCIS